MTPGKDMIISHIVYTPYETPIFSIIIVSGLAWVFAAVWGLKNPTKRIKAILLQLAINTEIGIFTALAYVWGIGTTVEASFAAGHYPSNPTMLPREKIPVIDPYVFLGELKFYYRIAEVGMWIYAITFLLTILGILLCWPKSESPIKP
jgi:hypothetical protein